MIDTEAGWDQDWVPSQACKCTLAIEASEVVAPSANCGICHPAHEVPLKLSLAITHALDHVSSKGQDNDLPSHVICHLLQVNAHLIQHNEVALQPASGADKVCKAQEQRQCNPPPLPAAQLPGRPQHDLLALTCRWYMQNWRPGRAICAAT